MYKEPDPLERACALVGRFQYHFASVEQKIDQAVIKLLDLDEKAATIVTSSLDFAKKLNFVRTYALQASKDEDKQFGEDTCNEVFAVNTDRQVVIHSSFECARGGGVQFRRTVAKDGRVRVDDQIWDDEKFSNYYAKMRGLEGKLDRLIQLLKPVEALPLFDWFSPLSPPPAQLRLRTYAPTVEVTWTPPPPEKESTT